MRNSMSVSHDISDDCRNVEIAIKGRFDYRVSQNFRDAYHETDDQEGVTYHINLSETEFMDSAALGMLLILRDYANSHHSEVCIDHPSKQAKNTLRIANFQQLFRIEDNQNTIDNKVA